jgi:hypothetical protein
MNNSNDPVTNAVSNVVTNGGKSVEKFLLYVLGTLVTTNVIDPGNLKPWLIASIGAVLTGLHISTPTPKSGPGQL